MGLNRHVQITWVNFAISLQYLKKEVENEVRDLTALAGSITALTILYTSNVLHHWPFSLFKIESMPSLFFIWLIACVT